MATEFKAFEALSDRHKLFVVHYIQENCNASKAMRTSGLAADHSSSAVTRVEAARLLSYPYVRAAIDELMSAEIGSPTESIQRLTIWSRACIDDVVDDEGKLDLAKARENGKIVCIKSITREEWFDKSKGTMVFQVKVELHDAKDAEKTLMKHRGMLNDTINVKQLPEDREELAKLLASELQRTTGKTVREKKGEAN